MSTLLVPKHAQPAYALEHFKIPDLSALPSDWNPSTHYANGRPITPTFPHIDKSVYETDDGAWLVPQGRLLPDAVTPLPSPPSSPDFITAGDNLLIWDDDRIGVSMELDENKVGEIKAKLVLPLLVKLIKKVKSLRKEAAVE